MKKVFCAVTSLLIILGLIFTGCTQSGSQTTLPGGEINNDPTAQSS